MHNGMTRILVAAATVASLSACAGEEKPRVVPTVADPIDLGALATSPCDALSEVQYKNLGIPQKGEEFHNRKEGRLACGWDDFSPATQLQFVPYPDKAILREVYENTPADIYRFEPYERYGFPIVAVVDDKFSGTCTVTVAVSESQGFQFVDLAETGPQVCNRALDAVWLVLQNLRRS